LSLLYLAALALAMLLTMVLALVLNNPSSPPSLPSSSSSPPSSPSPPPPPLPLEEDRVLFDVRFAGLDITQFADPAFDASFRTDFTDSIAQVHTSTHSQPNRTHCARLSPPIWRISYRERWDELKRSPSHLW